MRLNNTVSCVMPEIHWLERGKNGPCGISDIKVPCISITFPGINDDPNRNANDGCVENDSLYLTNWNDRFGCYRYEGIK